ncbi:hypothetical protein BHM03_00047334 [Ensete ventricosum]|uniref:Uncharacterized protein n=1 Tax=Ensete ventricosum TaxID=4639 RepID=A0A445ML45_ENSVE|nr:hypothetical protein BHM03_00047334 [Ensete ventricosum]
MEEKIRSLFTEFSIGRPSSPRKPQHGETSNRRDDPQEHGHITSDLNNPCMKVDISRWEEGDLIGWISCAERYFRFYRTADATQVKIAAIHLEGDVIRWEIVYPCIPDPDREDEGGQASSSLAVSTRWISAAKLLLSDLTTLTQREGGEYEVVAKAAAYQP